MSKKIAQAIMSLAAAPVLGDALEGGQFGDYGEYDDANAFGLNEFGELPAGAMNPTWGAVSSVGVGTLTAVGIRQFTDMDKYAEAIGFGAAMVPTGIMFAMKRTRAAGWAGLFAALLNHGPRFIEQLTSDKEAAKQAAVATTPAAGAFGAVEIQPRGAFGMVVPEATNAFAGALGAAPHPDLPQLVGTALGQAQRTLQVLNGPQLSELAARFGSTHFNK